MQTFTSLLYLFAAVLFILAIRGFSSPKTASKGNKLGMIGMGLVILTTAMLVGLSIKAISAIAIGGIIGYVLAKKIAMTDLPEMVAMFNGLGGLSSVLVSCAAFYSPAVFGLGEVGNIHTNSLIEMSISTIIGAITFTGSLIAFAKLHAIMTSKPVAIPAKNQINIMMGVAILVAITMLTMTSASPLFLVVLALGLVLGVLIVLPIGGADMPVVISMLNSYSGLAACGVGFTLHNTTLIIVGALVGASGAILSYIMCKAMNREFLSVISGGFGNGNASSAFDAEGKTAKNGAPEDAAFLMKNARSVIIVPGYGMAVAQAQHAVHDMAEQLKKAGVDVKYAIHPVAGRMPGHMNVLLAEANVPYEDVKEMDDINRDFASTDVAFVIGANDITNPAAHNDENSPIYGMPVLDVENAQNIFFVKRSLSPGYAGIPNELFYADNNQMLFGDAKKVTEQIIKALENL